VWPKDREVLFENVAEMVFRRTPLRARLGLLATDCDAKRPNRECCCLSDEALDDVGDQVTNKKAVLACRSQAPCSAEADPLDQPKPTPPMQQGPELVVASPPPTQKIVSETPTQPRLRPRYREPEHPLVWSKFKRERDSRSIYDTKF
jgi:hypothetical protein